MNPGVHRGWVTQQGLFFFGAVVLAGCTAQVRVAEPVVYAPPPIAEVQVNIAPPPLPVYVQPECPVSGWMWTPGYWRWDGAGYFWIPGTWVAPPRVGFLWTPGYWGFIGGAYVWHAGYWGPHVGFYGGVNYGFGYGGAGFVGGRWVDGAFAYNRSVTNVNVTVIHNTYNQTVINNTVNVTRVSYNGGNGGTRATPTAEDRRAERDEHIQPTAAQARHVEESQRNPALKAHANGGHPPIAATERHAVFHGPAVEHQERPSNPPQARHNGNHEQAAGTQKRKQASKGKAKERAEARQD